MRTQPLVPFAKDKRAIVREVARTYRRRVDRADRNS
jgi:hypothetical protein